MKKYDITKIDSNFTNNDYAKQFFPKSNFNGDEYNLGNGYRIIWIEKENFSIDYDFFDYDVGYVTNDDIFTGNFGECIEFILRDCGVNL